MERYVRARVFILSILVTGAVLLGSPGTAVSQGRQDTVRVVSVGEHPLRMDARSGIALPAADMRDYVDEGLVLGAGLAYRIGGRWSVRGDWTAALMRPADRTPLRNKGVNIPIRGSETDLHHLTGGLQAELSDPERADIEVRAHAGAGATFLYTEETELAEGGGFTQFTLDFGLELAVSLGEDLWLIGRGDLYVLPTQVGAPSHLKKEVTLPFTSGLTMGF